MKEKIKELFKEYYSDETMPAVELEDKVLALFDVVWQSEQLPNRCSICGGTDEERLTMTSMCGVSACPY